MKKRKTVKQIKIQTEHYLSKILYYEQYKFKIFNLCKSYLEKMLDAYSYLMQFKS